MHISPHPLRVKLARFLVEIPKFGSFLLNTFELKVALRSNDFPIFSLCQSGGTRS